ncbi:MAG: hypothetical protein IGBAC_2008 [Ignavibacteriae bacterium]|nr:MAG: hypothetical protein IGBAC_2008 [Ignavibacteriota bacterium]
MENGEIKKLYRSINDKWIAGVCGGIAEYLKVDAIIIRLLFILLILIGGTGIIFYLLAWIMVPVNPFQTKNRTNSDKSKTWGIIILILGLFLLLKNLGLIPLYDFFSWWDFMSWGTLISIILIIIGIFLIINQVKNPISKIEPQADIGDIKSEEIPRTKKILHKSRKDKKLAGVCAGIAEYLEIDVTIVRLIFVLITLSSLGLGLFLYIILAIVMPQEKENI